MKKNQETRKALRLCKKVFIWCMALDSYFQTTKDQVRLYLKNGHDIDDEWYIENNNLYIG